MDQFQKKKPYCYLNRQYLHRQYLMENQPIIDFQIGFTQYLNVKCSKQRTRQGRPQMIN